MAKPKKTAAANPADASDPASTPAPAEPDVKACLECHTVNPADTMTCSACGGGSWPGETVASEPMPDHPADAPPADDAPKGGT